MQNFHVKNLKFCAMCKCIIYAPLTLWVQQIKSEISCIYEHTLNHMKGDAANAILTAPFLWTTKIRVMFQRGFA